MLVLGLSLDTICVLVVILLIGIMSVVFIVNVLLNRMNKYYMSVMHCLDDVFGDLNNIVQGSKRTERIVDAINQRERARVEVEKKNKNSKSSFTKSKRSGRTDERLTRKYNKTNSNSSFDSRNKQSAAR